jgi:exodeoxyribonuclease-3
MKIACWNVNSLNVRLPHVLAWIAGAQPDVLALQETKLTDDRFPTEELMDAGYYSVFSGQKTYNGVAVLSREEARDPVTDIPGLDDPQRRILAVTVGDVRIVNLYVVNGSEVGSEKFEYKLHWLEQVIAWLATEMEQHENVVVLGDFNIAPDDRDVYDPEAWKGKILCSTQERDALDRILNLGLKDTFRMFELA